MSQKILIVTHVNHGYNDEGLYAYSAYVREMNLWLENIPHIWITAPLNLKQKTAIHLPYQRRDINFVQLSAFHTKNFKNILRSIFLIPGIFFRLLAVMHRVDHIHIRCPGNIGLIALIAQIFYPSKSKTIKYAGNWDKESIKPRSMVFQQFLCENEFLTRNAKVLVYGEWDEMSSNLFPFFTASYSEKMKKEIDYKVLSKEIVNLCFVGAFTKGKQPEKALEVLFLLRQKKINARLEFCGSGSELEFVKIKAEKLGLREFVTFHGNLQEAELIAVYEKSHFLVFLSSSEGWPKVVMESLWWGCIPITRSISCLPFLISDRRGMLLNGSRMKDVTEFIEALIKDEMKYRSFVDEGVAFSRQYTLEYFKKSINTLLHENN